jgi:hypothetical protein
MGLFLSFEVKALTKILTFTCGELDRFIAEATAMRSAKMRISLHRDNCLYNGDE